MPDGKVLTFYSYKGGTGRSMALANIAWLLASNGKRVLVIDWDLEAPGLHKYFGPFLSDPELRETPGLIDFVVDYAAAAASRTSTSPDSTSSGSDGAQAPWYAPYANLQRFAVPLLWDSDGFGRIDFVPSGRQGPSYASRVNFFEWQSFYERLQGGAFLDHAIGAMRAKYDYILIDSRTGVSDTSGICTVQLPDILVVFFTLNHQSVSGASAIATSAVSQRPVGRPLRVFPVPTRVDRSEHRKLELAKVRAQAIFYPLVTHIEFERRNAYWDGVQVDYEAFYSYEEILAPFAAQRHSSFGSMMGSVTRLAEYLTGMDLMPPPSIPETDRQKVLARFARLVDSDVAKVLENFALQYQEIRLAQKGGPLRTSQMTELAGRVAMFADAVEIQTVPAQLFARGQAQGQQGFRIVALALAEARPHQAHLPLVLQAIGQPKSPFEQYHGLLVAKLLVKSVGVEGQMALRAAIQGQLNVSIPQSDPSRWVLALDLLDISSSLIGQ